MNTIVISEYLKEAIGQKTVEGAFFTTFTFEPDFFELEILPLLYGSPVLSSHETIRRFQLQTLMQEQKKNISVFYDADIFANLDSPQLEVSYKALRHGRGCQHAKLVILNLITEQGKKEILLCAGSFNLTKAGWWESIECGHFVLLNSEYAPRNTCDELAKCLNFFNEKESTAAIRDLIATLADLPRTAADINCQFYFSVNHRSFADFIQFDGSRDLEIITPYFAQKSDNNVIDDFLDRFEKVDVLLPIDDSEDPVIATISKEIYDGLVKRSELTWCEWNKELTKKLKEGSDCTRRVHAKVFHLIGEHDSLFFVGSVNLSYQAFEHNLEAGFLVKLDKQGRFLTPTDLVPSTFEALVDESTQKTNDESFPLVDLTFDWVDKALSAKCEREGRLTLLDSQNDVMAELIFRSDVEVSLKLELCIAHFKKTALIDAHWQASIDSEVLQTAILVNQKRVFARPTELPPMTLQQLLEIYRGMNLEKKLDVVALQVQRFLLLRPELANEFSIELDDAECKNFFSAFSEINGAFFLLKQELVKALDAQNSERIFYYLSGEQPDSLKGTFQCLQDSNQQIDPVIHYLCLISIQELLEFKPTLQWRDSDLCERVRLAVEELESSEALELKSIDDKKVFFEWLKEEFSKSYSITSEEVSQ